MWNRHKLTFLLLAALTASVLAAADLALGIPYKTDLMLTRQGFALGYSKKYRQALWVSYILTSENLQSPKVRRLDGFSPDPAVKYRPVQPQDYLRTGYDRGHLAPAADMTYSLEPMKNSFFMTNISPQIPGCNRGIWKRLEKQIRLWALKEHKLCVITGPVFRKYNKRMGEAKIPVPYAFYKVVLDMTPPMKMIGFIVPNQATRQRIHSFVVTVDQMEELTGYDFFSELPDDEENALEKQSSFQEWPFM